MNLHVQPRWRVHAVVFEVLAVLFIPGAWMLWHADTSRAAPARVVPLTEAEQRRLAQRQAEQPEVLVAAYRYVFGKEPDVRFSTEVVLCIGMSGFGEDVIDHPPEFVRRFAAHTPSVAAGSPCHAETGMWFDDRHRSAVMVRTGVLTWHSPTRVTLGCEYDIAPEAAGGLLLDMHRDARGWRVVKRQLEWIS